MTITAASKSPSLGLLSGFLVCLIRLYAIPLSANAAQANPEEVWKRLEKLSASKRDKKLLEGAKGLVEEGNVLALKPAAMSEDTPDTIRCGDAVAVEPSGARRLGKRAFEFPSIRA